MKNNSQRRFSNGPWLVPNGLTQSFKELLTPDLLLCAALWELRMPPGQER